MDKLPRSHDAMSNAVYHLYFPQTHTRSTEFRKDSLTLCKASTEEKKRGSHPAPALTPVTNERS